MNTDDIPLIVALVGGIAICAATLYGIAALWAVAGSRGWLWRWAPLALLLAAFVPIGAYELLALYGSQAAIVVVWLAAGRWVRERRAAKARADDAEVPLNLARNVPQFPMRDMFKALALACAILAIVRNAAPNPAGTAAAFADWWQWAIAGLGQGVVTLAAATAVYARRRWYFRCSTLLASWIVAVLLIFVLTPAFQEFLHPFALSTPVSVLDLNWSGRIELDTMPVWIAGLQGIASVTFLTLLNLARVDSFAPRCGFIATAANESKTAFRRSRVRLARTMLICAAMAIPLMLAVIYANLLPPLVHDSEPLPVPNAYDDLVRLSARLNWTALPNQDSYEATDEACQLFVQDNAKTFAQMRTALATPSRTPLEFTDAYLAANLNSIGAFRSLARALVAEARAAAAAGNHGDASQSYLDTLRLAEKLSCGGLIIDDLVADAIAGFGLAGLATEMKHLDAHELDAVRQSLEASGRAREPIQTVLDRDRIWSQRALGWSGRLMIFFEQAIGGDPLGNLAFRDARDPVGALQQLILAEAAIRRHRSIEGSLPESLSSLVPKYLSAIPSDPYSKGPLVYRRAGDGYLLYSVGGNGTDDGGQRVSRHDATTNKIGDLFFDASYERSDDGDAAPNESDDPNEQEMIDAH